MPMTDTVRKILANYEGETPGVKAQLARMLMTGKLAGTGKMIILPVDQGFEHGPARSFAPNPAGYDPHYHYQLAIDAGLNAYAAPLGMIEAGADTFAGQIPTILKVNSANSLMSNTAGKNQAITASVDDALRLGCAAIGFTIYPGSDLALDMFSQKASMVATNVPGPQQPLYMAGSRLSDMMFWVPQSGSVGIGISILSYNGQVHFGLIADAKLIPDPDAVIQRFGTEFEKLLYLAMMSDWDTSLDAASACALLEDATAA